MKKKSKAGAKPKPKGERVYPVTTYHKTCDLELITIEVARDTAHRAIENKILKSRV